MPQMLTRTFMVIVLLLVAGAHWSVLQSIAWVSMTIQYSHESSISEALSKTLTGQAPCNLCKFVSEGRDSERDKNGFELPKRIDMLSTSRATLVEILQPEPEHATPHQELTVDLTPTPPTPPPRHV